MFVRVYVCLQLHKEKFKDKSKIYPKITYKKRKGNRGDRDGIKSSLNVYSCIVLTQESFECFT